MVEAIWVTNVVVVVRDWMVLLRGANPAQRFHRQSDKKVKRNITMRLRATRLLVGVEACCRWQINTLQGNEKILLPLFFFDGRGDPDNNDDSLEKPERQNRQI